MMKLLKCLPCFRGWTSGEIKEFLASFALTVVLMAMVYVTICVAYQRA